MKTVDWYDGLEVEMSVGEDDTFAWKFTDWLDGDTLTNKQVDADTGITADGGTVNGDNIEVVISAPSTGFYAVTVTAVAGSRKLPRTVYFRVS